MGITFLFHQLSEAMYIVNLVFVGAIYPDVCEFSEAAMSSVDGGHV